MDINIRLLRETTCKHLTWKRIQFGKNMSLFLSLRKLPEKELVINYLNRQDSSSI